jgi:hypothetical protein
MKAESAVFVGKGIFGNKFLQKRQELGGSYAMEVRSIN